MQKIKIHFILFIQLIFVPIVCLAQEDSLGQTIQINTRFHSFMGRPSWLLIIRDVDKGQNIPFQFDITRGENFWVAFTSSRNYLITVSTLSFSPYRRNPYGVKEIKNFCNLESHGRIIRGQSITVQLQGDLTPDTNTFVCTVSRYQDTSYYTVTPGQ